MSEDRDPALDASGNASRRSFLENMSWRTVLDAFLGPESASKKKPAYEGDSDVTHFAITFESSGRRIEAFRCRPNTDEKRAGVIVVHEIFGLNDHMKDLAYKLAKAGYDALAVDFFTREGKSPQDLAQAVEFAAGVPDAQVIGDVDAAARYLRSQTSNNNNVGIVGFTWGARLAVLALASLDSLNAGVAYCATIRNAPTANQPRSILDVASQIHGPLLAHFGGKDTAIPLDDVTALRSELDKNPSVSDIQVYDEAGHAFNNNTRLNYDEESARLAWRRTLEWLDRYLR